MIMTFIITIETQVRIFAPIYRFIRRNSKAECNMHYQTNDIRQRKMRMNNDFPALYALRTLERFYK